MLFLPDQYSRQIIIHIAMSKTCQQCGRHGDGDTRPLLDTESIADNKTAGGHTEFTADSVTVQNKNYESIA